MIDPIKLIKTFCNGTKMYAYAVSESDEAFGEGKNDKLAARNTIKKIL